MFIGYSYYVPSPDPLYMYVAGGLACIVYCIWADVEPLFKWLVVGFSVCAGLIDLLSRDLRPLGAKLLIIPFAYVVAYFLIFRRMERTRW